MRTGIRFQSTSLQGVVNLALKNLLMFSRILFRGLTVYWLVRRFPRFPQASAPISLANFSVSGAPSIITLTLSFRLFNSRIVRNTFEKGVRGNA
jgi:hypothetical protein